MEVSKREYIGGIEGGMIDYKLWEADSPIQVRLHGDVAAIRYRALIEIAVQGELQPRQVPWQLLLEGFAVKDLLLMWSAQGW